MLKEIVRYPLKISGVSSNEYRDVKSPFSGESIASVAQADESAIKAAITIAQDTFNRVTRKLPAYQRSSILTRTAGALTQHLEELACTIALEGGKPIKEARIEVARAINTFTIAAEETLHLEGEQIAMDRQQGNEARLAFVLREPLGVIAGITPFNFPLNLVAHKVAPAIAAGNTVVLKPSSQTPISSLKLLELMLQKGLPEGALQVVPCQGSKAEALVADPRLSMLTFTGSPAVGWQLRQKVAPGVRLVLELGGNAGIVVHNDADLDAAARAACRGGYGNAGQTCISVQRVYVQEDVYDRFLDIFTNFVKQLKMGDPESDQTDVGPMIDEKARDKAMDWINDAVRDGARIVTGGQKDMHTMLEPTVLVDTRSDMSVINREVLAPVVSVMKYKQIDEALDAMNDTRYGLQAGVFTRNIEVAFKAARALDVGGVMINDGPTFRADHMPYGGRKESGIGLEGVRYAIHEMTQPKFICMNLPKES